MMWWTGYWPMPWVGPLIMVGFIVLCGAVLVWVMRAMTGPIATFRRKNRH